MAKDAYIKQKTANLKKEIAGIEEEFYPRDGEDFEQALFNWQMKRDHSLRAVIVELHLSIENLLEDFIKAYFAKHDTHSKKGKVSKRSATASNIEDLFVGEYALGFRDKLAIAKVIRIITPKTFKKLEKLNSIRNRVSHGWRLNVITRRKVKRSKKKKPLLEFNGTNLYKRGQIHVFIREYGSIYLRLFLKLMKES